MLVNINNAIENIREREQKYCPEPSWFSNLDEDKFQTFMTKYSFESFESIPKDTSGFSFPEFEDINFTIPSIYPKDSVKIVNVDGLILLNHLGIGAFCIDPRRWHRIKKYIAGGKIVYPEASNKFGILDGRHRILLLMQTYNRRTVPVVVENSYYEQFILEAKRLNAL